MARSVFLFLFLVAAPFIYTVVASDVCLSKDESVEAVAAASPQPFFDLSDAGLHFVQVVKRATHGNQALRSPAVQPTPDASQRGAIDAVKESPGALADQPAADIENLRQAIQAGEEQGMRASELKLAKWAMAEAKRDLLNEANTTELKTTQAINKIFPAKEVKQAAMRPSANATLNEVVHVGNKTLGAVSSQSSGKSTRRGVTEVLPLECSQSPPMQVMKSDDGFALKKLVIRTGAYEEFWDFPFDRVEGGYAEMNACDINPFDDILYCVMRSEGECYAVRLDAERIEFVAILPPSVWSAGSFAYTGEYFVSMTGAELIVVPPIHEEQGYPDKDDARLKNYRSLKAEKPEGFMHTSDTVVIKYDFPGDGAGEGEYLISLYGPKLEIGKFENGECKKTWIKEISPSRWDNIYGAGFNFRSRVLFTVNRGAGLYSIPLEEVDLDDEDQVVELKQIGPSDATDFNDGVNCKNVDDPYGQEVAGEPAEPTEEPLFGSQAEVPEIPITPEEPVAPETPAPAVAAPAPAPDNSRSMAWLLLMYTIPIMLCYACLIPFVPSRFNPFPWFWAPSFIPPPHAPPAPPAPPSPPPPRRSPFFSTLTRSFPPPKPPTSPQPPSSTATLRTVVLEPEQPPKSPMSPMKSEPIFYSPPPTHATPMPEPVRTQYMPVLPAPAPTVSTVETVMAAPPVLMTEVPAVQTAYAAQSSMAGASMGSGTFQVTEVMVPEVIVPTAGVQQVREVILPNTGMQAITRPAAISSPVAGNRQITEVIVPGGIVLQRQMTEIIMPASGTLLGSPHPVSPH